MALLTPKISVEVAKDGKSLVILDQTNVYDASLNPGGYSTGSNFPSEILIELISWDALNKALSKHITFTNSTITAAKTVGYFYLTVMNENNSAFDGGVWNLNYYPFGYSTTAPITLTKDSKLVSTTGSFLSGLSSDSEAILPAGLEPYAIDKSKPITSTTLYLKEAYRGDTSTVTSYKHGPRVQIKLLIATQAESCVSKEAAAICTCGTDFEREVRVNRMLSYLQAAQYDFDCLNFDGADKLVKYVDKMCEEECNVS